MRKLGIVLLMFFVFSSCNNSNKSSYVANDDMSATKNETHPGKKLMETNCYVCHSPTASQEDRIGPPMIAIKKHYINEGTTKEEFVNAMQAWLKNPIEENAKMFGAVRRFGVMPKTPYPEETIELISEYIFNNEIEQPEWFEEHFNEMKGKGNRN